MKTRTVTHKEVFRHLCENLDQEMNSENCRHIKKHLEGCRDCIAYLDSLKMTVSLYRNYPSPRLSRKAQQKLRGIIRLQR